jgi:hypothetical protein
MHPHLPAAPLFGIPQSMERRRREPGLRAENDELPQPRAGSIELRLEVGSVGRRGFDRGGELELTRAMVVHRRSLGRRTMSLVPRIFRPAALK